MKKEKIIARIGLWGIFTIGILTLASIMIFPEKVNFLTPYEIWGFGIVCIVISILFLYREYQKPKKHRKKF